MHQLEPDERKLPHMWINTANIGWIVFACMPTLSTLKCTTLSIFKNPHHTPFLMSQIMGKNEVRTFVYHTSDSSSCHMSLTWSLA